MEVYIIAYDKNEEIGLLKFIRREQTLNPLAYFFCSCYRKKSRFGLGALFNSTIQMAGLSNNCRLIFCSLKHGKLNRTLSVGNFMRLNGFDNYSNRLSLPFCKARHGYEQIYTDSVTQKHFGPCYIYTVDIAEDRILNTDVFRHINVKI